MQGRRGGPPRIAAEPKAPPGRRDKDINRERLAFCLTSLVGHKITAKLRNNHIYTGVFHSCSLEGDLSITLKYAKLASEFSAGSSPAKNSKPDWAPVIETLIIPGKDFLMVTACDVPPPPAGLAARGGAGFQTDAEIADKKGNVVRERELVPWSGGDGAPTDPGLAIDEPGVSGRHQTWDQFKRNEDMYGVVSTFREDLYTTKLDPDSIPRAKREEAERIAREIEGGGRSYAEAEGALDDDDNEEGLFSSVPRGKGYGRGDAPAERDRFGEKMALARAGSGAATSSGKAAGRGRGTSFTGAMAIPQVPLTEEHLTQHDSLSGAPGDYAQEHRTKRGMITAHSPMRSPMVSEMKRINALNLEPALPKLDDKTRNDWINFKQLAAKNSTKLGQGHDFKAEFTASLEAMNKKSAEKQQAPPRPAEPSERRPKPSALALPGDMGGHSGSAASPSQARCGEQPSTMTGGDSTRSSKFAFNVGAKEFSFNPTAAAFTPTNAAGTSGRKTQTQMQAADGPQLQLTANKMNEHMLTRGLNQILDQLYDGAVKESVAVSGVWPGATGATFRKALGEPNPNAPHPMAPVGPMAPGAAPSNASWPQQASGGHGAGPQMMGQGAYMVAAPAGPGGQQQAQMYPSQMYAAGPQGNSQAPRPPHGQGGSMQGGNMQGGNMQGSMQGGNMQSGNMQGGNMQGGNMQGNMQGGNMQPMMMQQQTMMQPSQSMAIPGGMVAQGGQNQAMASMAKFGQVQMAMPAGQFNPQGFVPQQAVQGQQSGQPGQAGCPQQNQMMQQGSMMQQGQMMQPYR